MKFFDLEWSTEDLFEENNVKLYKVNNEDIGDFYITEKIYGDYFEDKKNSIKYIALIREAYLSGFPLIFCDPKEISVIIKKIDFKHNIQSLKNLLINYPNNFNDKRIRALINISKYSKNYGDRTSINKFYDVFAENENEFHFILNSLLNNNLINGTVGNMLNRKEIISPISITDYGWEIVEKNNKSNYSKNVFVAMWFDNKMDDYFNTISEVLDELGFNTIRIDKKEHNNEISGEILYEIKQSGFIIADVTGQRNGVYFESGYAMGLGIPVIFICLDTDLKNVHFDTRQYNHIVYSNTKELKEKLISRIKGVILINEI